MASPASEPTAVEVIEVLGLAPHPEGGHFRETFRDAATVDANGNPSRAASTAIYFLLAAGEISRRPSASEIVSASGDPAYQCHTSAASTRCQREISPAASRK